MSVQAQAWVIDRSQHGGTALLVLLMIANNCDTDGRGTMLLADLARQARLSVRTIYRVVERIEASGELVVRRHARANGTTEACHWYELPGVVADRYHIRGIPGKKAANRAPWESKASPEPSDNLSPASAKPGDNLTPGQVTKNAKQVTQLCHSASFGSVSPLNTKNPPLTPPVPGGGTKTVDLGPRDILAHIPGGYLLVHNAKGRRLWTVTQLAALVGASPEDYAANLTRRGMPAEVVDYQPEPQA